MRRLVLTQSLKVQKIFVSVLGRPLRNRKLRAPSWLFDAVFGTRLERNHAKAYTIGDRPPRDSTGTQRGNRVES